MKIGNFVIFNNVPVVRLDSTKLCLSEVQINNSLCKKLGQCLTKVLVSNGDYQYFLCVMFNCDVYKTGKFYIQYLHKQ